MLKKFIDLLQTIKPITTTTKPSPMEDMGKRIAKDWQTKPL